MSVGPHGEFAEHELIHLLDSIDDERAKARFREAVYISVIIWLAVAWFLFYGPRILFHQPYYKDPIALMKQHDREQLTYIAPSAPMPRVAPKIDRKTMETLKQQAQQRQLQAPPTPQPPVQQPPQPQEEAHNAAPPVPQPPLPAAPRPAPNAPSAPLPAAPAPNFARNESPQSALQNAMRGAIATRGSGITAPGSSAGPLQAGATILSDTQGVDFDAYMRRLHDIVQRNWEPLIPEEVAPPLRKRGIVGIRFSILPDGQIGDIKLETTSGDVALDKAAWYAITSSGQFPSLPKAFHGPDLDLRVGFFYNVPMER
ncbi:MAG TPA: TonB family protein [Acidobacteriaceae bacterium]